MRPACVCLHFRNGIIVIGNIVTCSMTYFYKYLLYLVCAFNVFYDVCFDEVIKLSCYTYTPEIRSFLLNNIREKN